MSIYELQTARKRSVAVIVTICDQTPSTPMLCEACVTNSPSCVNIAGCRRSYNKERIAGRYKSSGAQSQQSADRPGGILIAVLERSRIARPLVRQTFNSTLPSSHEWIP